MTDSPPASTVATADRHTSTVCFCFRKSLADLRADYTTYGSLARMQDATRVGMQCGGCRALLHHHFGETPVEISDLSHDDQRGATVCVKPGNRVMKCFIASSSLLESRAFSSNAVPLQLGECDSSMTAEFTLYNHLGKPIMTRRQPLATGETFSFDTALERLPRPFYGMIAYRLERKNYGASRLNVAWHSGDSMTSTHENFSTGRPDVVLPVPVDDVFLNGPNDIYLAVQNPHSKPREIVFRLFQLSGGNIYEDLAPTVAGVPPKDGAMEFRRVLPPLGTDWIHASREFYTPALKLLKGPLALRIYTPGVDIHQAPSTYFFLHHREQNIWSSNHL